MEVIVVLAILCAFVCCAGLAAGVGIFATRAARSTDRVDERIQVPAEPSAER